MNAKSARRLPSATPSTYPSKVMFFPYRHYISSVSVSVTVAFLRHFFETSRRVCQPSLGATQTRKERPYLGHISISILHYLRRNVLGDFWGAANIWQAYTRRLMEPSLRYSISGNAGPTSSSRILIEKYEITFPSFFSPRYQPFLAATFSLSKGIRDGKDGVNKNFAQTEWGGAEESISVRYFC